MPAKNNTAYLVRVVVALCCVSLVRANESLSTIDVDAPIQLWSVEFVDGETAKPLPGIKVDASVSMPHEADQQLVVLVSDASGRIKVPLRPEKAAFLHVRGPGWCHGCGFPVVGNLPKEFRGDAPSADPKKLRTIKLHRGTEVRGRLLLPEGSPASGVKLHAAVSSSRPPWVNENLTNAGYSTERHADWESGTTSEEDGSFSVTVPPKEARNWLHLGTTGGDWQVMDTEFWERTNPEHPLVRYAPLEIDIEYDDANKFSEKDGVLNLGDVRFNKGIVLKGRVLDAHGAPLAGLKIFTSSSHGPLAGRCTTSREDGTFEFLPMYAGTFKLKPKDDGPTDCPKFAWQEVTLVDGQPPKELIVQALSE